MGSNAQAEGGREGTWKEEKLPPHPCCSAGSWEQLHVKGPPHKRQEFWWCLEKAGRWGQVWRGAQHSLYRCFCTCSIIPNQKHQVLHLPGPGWKPRERWCRWCWQGIVPSGPKETYLQNRNDTPPAMLTATAHEGRLPSQLQQKG